VALIDAARSALSSGMADRALDALAQYQSRYPAGSFRPEATALRVEALARSGRSAEARALAERFVSEHPGSPLADRVARAAGLSSR
jgi:outer membrane protein assembly factor BamD (BamD/ComL family)